MRIMQTVIVIPTFNEKENIGLLLWELQRHFPVIPHPVHLLVVDDESPDGTAHLVRAMQDSFANLHLLTGRRAGLGTAYIRGMRYAMERLGADAVLQMDADFSHKPEDTLRLMAVLDQGFDVVIGSRYVPGGRIPERWGVLRKSISRWGNLAARHLMGLSSIHDCTAGFRAIRSSVLRRITLSDIKVQGYAFQVALLRAALDHGAAVREIPVEFVDRMRGKSKLGLKDLVEFVVGVCHIALKR